MNSRWWKWWRESHHCCLHFWIGKLLPTRDMWFFSFLRNFCQGKLKPFVTCPSSIFQYFFAATEEMSILSHAAQHWPKVINWRFYKKSCSKCTCYTAVADAKQWQVTKKFIFQRVKTACNSNEEDDKKALCFFNEANVPCIHNCFVFSKKHEVSP